MLISDNIKFKIFYKKRQRRELFNDKGFIQEDIIIINISAPNLGAPKYIKQVLTDLKVEIENNTVIVMDLNWKN